MKGRSAECSSFLGSSSHMPEQNGLENCSQPCGEPTAEEPGGDRHLVVLRSVLVSRQPLTSSEPWGVVVMRNCLPEGDQVVSGRSSLPSSLIPARATCICLREQLQSKPLPAWHLWLHAGVPVSTWSPSPTRFCPC